ncbi:MAG: hypothetical protein KME08_17635 [Aphanothece sp. CMT-3BRIN-NPC111]|jgi:hypothetical protein|nr:hypothetical protein [Aphanothece sp. CMT-3BRIN-NPC111]
MGLLLSRESHLFTLSKHTLPTVFEHEDIHVSTFLSRKFYPPKDVWMEPLYSLFKLLMFSSFWQQFQLSEVILSDGGVQVAGEERC